MSWLWTVGIFLSPIFILLGIAGAIQKTKEPGYWDRYADPRLIKSGGRLPRDSHAKARQDGAFVDGMITDRALQELDDMFD